MPPVTTEQVPYINITSEEDAPLEIFRIAADGTMVLGPGVNLANALDSLLRNGFTLARRSWLCHDGGPLEKDPRA